MERVALAAMTDATVGAWRVLDPQTTWWSPEMFDLFGLDRSAPIPNPKQIFTMYHPDDAYLVGRMWASLFSGDAQQTLRHRIIRGDGALRHILSRSRRLAPDANGDRWVCGICIDVTETLDDGDLFEQERNLRFLSENMRDVVLRLDTAREITFTSHASQRMLGWVDEHLLGRAALDLIHPDDREQVAATYEARSTVRQFSHNSSLDYRIMTARGDYIWVESNPRPVVNGGGEITGFVDVIRDVTERRAAQDAAAAAMRAAEAAAAAKSEFLANMSHELRTPLTSILGFSKLIDRSTTLPAGERHFLELVQTSSETLLAVVNDILDFSRIEAGVLELCPVDFRLDGLVDEIVELLGQQALSKRITLSAVGADTMTLRGDSTRLRQVLLNLVGNAVKFTGQGSVTITCESAASMPGHRQVTIRVTDTGIGIPPDRLAAVFDRFSQVDSSISRRFGGTGLGLAIAQRLIRQMGGNIGVESDGVSGSTFWFTLALPIADVAVEDVVDYPGISPDRPLQLLLAEDNPANVLLVQTLLEPFEIDVTVASNGLEAFERARAQVFDVILMDMQMPVLDGPSAARRIRTLPGKQGCTPIIALTANVMPEQIQACTDAGMQGHVGKPITPDVLLRAIVDHTTSGRAESSFNPK